MSNNEEKKYYLMRKEVISGLTQYFDFERAKYSNRKSKAMTIATIDSLTTIFTDGNELDAHFDRETDREFKYKIIVYKDNKNKHLNVIWYDPTLKALTTLKDGKVNFTGERQAKTMLNIISELKNPESNFRRKVLNTKRDEFKITYESKVILAAFIKKPNDENLNKFIEAFSSYEDCRALYLAYKDHLLNKDKSSTYIYKKIKRP